MEQKGDERGSDENKERPSRPRSVAFTRSSVDSPPLVRTPTTPTPLPRRNENVYFDYGEVLKQSAKEKPSPPIRAVEKRATPPPSPKPSSPPIRKHHVPLTPPPSHFPRNLRSIPPPEQAKPGDFYFDIAQMKREPKIQSTPSQPSSVYFDYKDTREQFQLQKMERDLSGSNEDKEKDQFGNRARPR